MQSYLIFIDGVNQYADPIGNHKSQLVGRIKGIICLLVHEENNTYYLVQIKTWNDGKM